MYLNNITSTGFANNNDAQARTTREATIVQHLTHVYALAKRLRSHVPPCVTLDDLIGAGTIGLIQAVDRFQPSRGLQFATYAKHRIRCARSTSFARKTRSREPNGGGPERELPPPKGLCPRQSAWNSFRRMNRGVNTHQHVASQLASRIEWTWAAPGSVFRRERTKSSRSCLTSTGRTAKSRRNCGSTRAASLRSSSARFQSFALICSPPILRGPHLRPVILHDRQYSMTGVAADDRNVVSWYQLYDPKHRA